MSKIHFYRYHVTYEEDGVVYNMAGFVAGPNYHDAVARLEKVVSQPGSVESLISDVMLVKLDSYDGAGVIEDDVVAEIYQEENK